MVPTKPSSDFVFNSSFYCSALVYLDSYFREGLESSLLIKWVKINSEGPFDIYVRGLIKFGITADLPCCAVARVIEQRCFNSTPD